MTGIRVGIIGGLGRLGRSILDQFSPELDLHLSCVVESDRSVKKGDTLADHGYANLKEAQLTLSLEKITQPLDVLIDVTLSEHVGNHLRWAVQNKIPYLCAVTGLLPETVQEMEASARKIPIIRAPNLSVGIAVLNELVRISARTLPDFEARIVETHHKNKKDAPSGTALALAETIQNERDRPLEEIRGKIQSIREGDIVGEHTVRFMGEGQEIELRHNATSRSVFASGAIAAARFLAGQDPGLYTIRDVLNLQGE